jgi:hypothetical protein
MNDVEPEGSNSPEELDTTAPNPPAPERPAGGWAMPEPTFQQSSGYLPQGGYIDQINASMTPLTSVEGDVEPAPEPPAEVRAEAFAPSLTPVDADPDQALGADVEPQPDLNEQLEEAPAAFIPTPVAKDNGSGRSVVMVVLGLVAMVLFIVAFLAVIYFLFIAPSGGESQF